MWPPCYRCSSCGGRSSCSRVPSFEYNQLWLLLPYPLLSKDLFSRRTPLRSSCCFALNNQTFCHDGIVSLPLSLRLRIVGWLVFHQSHEAPSLINGGNRLHILLHNFGKACPEVIHHFISERIEIDLASCGTSQWNGFNPLMLLQRDAFGNLPIHVASSIGVPIKLLFDLLRLTLETQKFWMGTAFCPTNLTSTDEKVTLQSTDPYLLSKNDNGRSLLDIELLRFIDDERCNVPDEDFCFQVTRNMSSKLASYELLRDAARQMISNCGRNIRDDFHRGVMTTHLPLPPSLFLKRIKCIILSAYEELHWLLAHHGKKCSMCKQSGRFYRHRENVAIVLDWLPDSRTDPKFMTREDTKIPEIDLLKDNPYILHYASALSGPTVIVNDVDCSRREWCIITRISSYLLQVSRPFLDLLLLEDNALQACNIPHPSSGQVPLHFAVQAGLALFSGSCHCRRFAAGGTCNAYVWNAQNIDEWKYWIQNLIKIDPSTCSAKDYMNRIPLHYILLRSFSLRRACFDELDGSMYSCCRKEFHDYGTDFLHMKSLDCDKCRRLPFCLLEVPVDTQNDVITFMIRFNPESIEMPCRIRFRTIAYLTDEREDTVISCSNYSCLFEVYQIAAMAYPLVSLDTLYTILRMCPSRCFLVPTGMTAVMGEDS